MRKTNKVKTVRNVLPPVPHYVPHKIPCISPWAFVVAVLAAGGLVLACIHHAQKEVKVVDLKTASIETTYKPSYTYEDCHLENETEEACKGYWVGFSTAMKYCK